MTKARDKQTANRRSNGTFAPGNKLGRKFEPGATGNPQGRPKITAITEALRIQLAEVMPDANERTYAEAIAGALIAEAVKGNVIAAKEIADRTEGKPRQSLDVDMSVRDWRAMARSHGLNQEDVLREARLLIESTADSSDA